MINHNQIFYVSISLSILFVSVGLTTFLISFAVANFFKSKRLVTLTQKKELDLKAHESEDIPSIPSPGTELTRRLDAIQHGKYGIPMDPHHRRKSLSAQVEPPTTMGGDPNAAEKFIKSKIKSHSKTEKPAEKK